MPANLNTRLTLNALEDRDVPAVMIDWVSVGPQPEPPTRFFPAVQKAPVVIAPGRTGAVPADPIISKPTPGSFDKILLPSLIPQIKQTPAEVVIQKLSTGLKGPVGPIIKEVGAVPSDPIIKLVGAVPSDPIIKNPVGRAGAVPSDPGFPTVGDIGGAFLV